MKGNFHPNFTTLSHGHSRRGAMSPTYRAWANMRSRCGNPKTKNYSDYGGRGITVCDRWAVFENFLADMGVAPPGLMLDRKDNDKGYNKDNCRWATRAVQNRNQRSNRFLEYNGEVLCLADWEKKLGLGVSTLWWHLQKGGTMEQAMKIKPRPNRRKQKLLAASGTK